MGANMKTFFTHWFTLMDLTNNIIGFIILCMIHYIKYRGFQQCYVFMYCWAEIQFMEVRTYVFAQIFLIIRIDVDARNLLQFFFVHYMITT